MAASDQRIRADWVHQWVQAGPGESITLIIPSAYGLCGSGLARRSSSTASLARATVTIAAPGHVWEGGRRSVRSARERTSKCHDRVNVSAFKMD
jgi:hypothetical protein